MEGAVEMAAKNKETRLYYVEAIRLASFFFFFFFFFGSVTMTLLLTTVSSMIIMIVVIRMRQQKRDPYTTGTHWDVQERRCTQRAMQYCHWRNSTAGLHRLKK